MDYLQLLTHSHAIQNTYLPKQTKHTYILSQIMGVYTYDDSLDTFLANKATEVALAITERTTFTYIKDETNYIWYITMLHWPFFAERIEWGTSIRGAWWDFSDTTFKLNTCGLSNMNGEQITDWEFTSPQWEQLMKACYLYLREKS